MLVCPTIQKKYPSTQFSECVFHLLGCLDKYHLVRLSVCVYVCACGVCVYADCQAILNKTPRNQNARHFTKEVKRNP